MLLLISALIASCEALKPIDKLVESAMQVIAYSHLGSTIRQCSCAEDRECVKSMEEQALQCYDECWPVFSQITSNPEALRKCASSKMSALSSLIGCLGTNLHSCVKTARGPQIPQVDLRRLFTIGEQQLNATSAEVLNNDLIANIRPLAATAILFGSCVKQCFVDEKNGDGFCYDKKRCQPLITKNNLRSALRSCLATINWRENLADLCQCAQDVGLRFETKDMCGILRYMRGLQG
ncbi:hypothetical protein Angca_000470 [Angiostrongylus cantonensis]|nr:hypothetical protein Angca_000470 [Angiostrongylus cantonensis]